MYMVDRFGQQFNTNDFYNWEKKTMVLLNLVPHTLLIDLEK